jgi:hypothetical protein
MADKIWYCPFCGYEEAPDSVPDFLVGLFKGEQPHLGEESRACYKCGKPMFLVENKDGRP